MNDIVPQYAAVGMSIGNTFASMMGFVAPTVAGVLLKTYGNSVSTWITVWLICGVIMLGGGLFYTLCSSADPLPWTVDDVDEKDDEKRALK